MFKNSLIFFRRSISSNSNNARIFFGNFPIGATETSLKKFFNGCGEIDSVTFFKVDPTGTSQGYGSILFKDEASLENAIKLNTTLLQDKPVTVKKWEGAYRLGTGRNAEPMSPNYPPSNILYVGNLPFETENDSLVNLFSEYGTVVSCRRPYDKLNERPKG